MARAGMTAERLTQAAAELADEIGFENVTVSALARRFGVKDPSLYSHIKNAQELRVRVALLALEELADRAAAALAGRAGKDALVAFANAYRDYAKEHPGRYAATQFELDPETAATSAAPRHARDDAGDPARLRPARARPDRRGTHAGQHVPRVREPGDGGRVPPHPARGRRLLGLGSGRPRLRPQKPFMKTGMTDWITTLIHARILRGDIGRARGAGRRLTCGEVAAG